RRPRRWSDPRAPAAPPHFRGRCRGRARTRPRRASDRGLAASGSRRDAGRSPSASPDRARPPRAADRSRRPRPRPPASTAARTTSRAPAREAWGEAGEIYLRRAVVERDPATLKGIFLRLGEIHSLRAPDPKRAEGAYERVLGIDPENVEALRALSDLT